MKSMILFEKSKNRTISLSLRSLLCQTIAKRAFALAYRIGLTLRRAKSPLILYESPIHRKEHENILARKKSRFIRPAITIGTGIILTFVMIQSAFGYSLSFSPGSHSGGSIGEGETKTFRMTALASSGGSVVFRLTSTNPDTLRVNNTNVSIYLWDLYPS